MIDFIQALGEKILALGKMLITCSELPGILTEIIIPKN